MEEERVLFFELFFKRYQYISNSVRKNKILKEFLMSVQVKERWS